MGTATPVVFWEIRGKDMSVLRDFYGSLFDWQFPEGDARTVPIDGNDKDDGFGLSGSVAAGSGDGWVAVYVRVPDIDASLVEVTAHGGRIIRGRTDPPGRATFAIVADPEGHILGLVQA